MPTIDWLVNCYKGGKQMKRKIIIISILCLLLFSSISAYAVEELMLNKEEVIDLALKQSREIAKLEYDVEIAKKDLKQAKAAFYPNIDATGVYTRLGEEPVNPRTMQLGSKNSYRFSLGLEQPIYMGGQIRAGYEQVQKALEMANLELEKKKQELTYQVSEQYYNILKIKKIVELNQQTVKKIENYVKIAEVNKEVGIFTSTDVLQARVNLTRAKQGLLQTRNQLKLARMALENTLVLDASQSLYLDDELKLEAREIDEVEIRDYAFENRIELRLLNLQEDSLELNLARAEGSRYPTVSLGADYSTNNDGFFKVSDGEWQINLMLNYNIFSGGEERAKIEKAQQEIEKFKLSKEDLKAGIDLEIEESLLNLEEAKERIQLMELSLEEARENLEQTELKYQEGIITSTEVLDAQTTLKQVQTDYFQAICDYDIASAKLDKVMGKVVKEDE